MNFIKKIFGMGPKAPADLTTLGRNDNCWCGSGDKYKRCHWEADQGRRARERAACQGSS